MRKGGGKQKGAEFERVAGKALSLWLTSNERGDIFSRNVLSGGSFTLASAAGKQSSRMPGDLMAANPLAFKFLSVFMIECKHLASLGLENYLFDFAGSSPLAQIISFAAGQAKQAGLEYMIIAKQNFRQPFVILDSSIARRAFTCILSHRRRVLPMYHMLHRQSVCIMQLDDFLKRVDPTLLLKSE